MLKIANKLFLRAHIEVPIYSLTCCSNQLSFLFQFLNMVHSSLVRRRQVLLGLMKPHRLMVPLLQSRYEGEMLLMGKKWYRCLSHHFLFEFFGKRCTFSRQRYTCFWQKPNVCWQRCPISWIQRYIFWLCCNHVDH